MSLVTNNHGELRAQDAALLEIKKEQGGGWMVNESHEERKSDMLLDSPIMLDIAR
jgi:hypothetical protein